MCTCVGVDITVCCSRLLYLSCSLFCCLVLLRMLLVLTLYVLVILSLMVVLLLCYVRIVGVVVYGVRVIMPTDVGVFFLFCFVDVLW